MYPQTITAFRAAAMAYQPPAAITKAICAAQEQGSSVALCVDVFTALKDAPDLDRAGLSLLLGAAHLIASQGWNGLGGAAATVLAQRGAELARWDIPRP